jgi:tRNA1(Val) A37 N6-methylase TrmN6|tara:strand:- start:6 stop:446 length:441 start_codon:yes stop_codon:yes gene_type:complete
MTPRYLAKAIVEHFEPSGKILEPCCGTGNFLKYMKAEWCEISLGKDFFNYRKRVDWIITNPPWSKVRNFLQQSMKIADNIVFLITINHLWTKARLRDMKEAGFGIKEICMIPEKTPDFPQTGFRCGACHIKRGYKGDIKLSELSLH